ncbi:alpha/beta-hydrolase [Wallemia mellicola]|uniref:Alpha/beta-hydrolase n=1 Tax=Wallemia mellicola TaxID=1708541 RepID=A0AB74KBY5_9BASI|nr:alpha/beta-hydrolase [Wallemia mellicola]
MWRVTSVSVAYFYLIAIVQPILGVDIRSVQFLSKGIPISGNLYIPDNIETDSSLPGIVVGHPWGGVKEQTAGLHARQLAEHGFVTLAFDAATQGESGSGTLPRLIEDPYQRVEDIKNAVTFLSVQDSLVDSERIGALGICASGGYVSFAAQTDKRIKAIATVSAFDVGRITREPFGGGEIQYDTLNDSLKSASNNRTGIEKGAPPTIAWNTPNSTVTFTPETPTLYQEGYEYYHTPRGQHKNAPMLYVPESVDLMATYSSFAFVDLIAPRPYLMIAGSIADTLYFSRDAIERALEPKELFLVENATHIDLYDHLDVTLPKLVDFMSQNL